MVNETEKKEYILCAALHYKDNKEYVHQPKNIVTGIVVCGRRHHNCITTLALLLGDRYDISLMRGKCQGFLTNTDRWVTRQEAFKIAKAAGQLSWDAPDKHGDKENVLFSEDLY